MGHGRPVEVEDEAEVEAGAAEKGEEEKSGKKPRGEVEVKAEGRREVRRVEACKEVPRRLAPVLGRRGETTTVKVGPLPSVLVEEEPEKLNGPPRAGPKAEPKAASSSEKKRSSVGRRGISSASSADDSCESGINE